MRYLSPLLLIGALIAGAAWHYGALARQHIDIGDGLDDGAALYFNAPERSADGAMTFRWTQPRSEIHLAAPPAATRAALTLRAFPPPAPAPPTVAVTVDGATARFRLEPEARVYRLLIAAPERPELVVVLTAPGAPLAGDRRAIGFGLDWVGLTAVDAPSLAGLAQTERHSPELPLALLSLACAAALLGGRRQLWGLAAPGALGALALIGGIVPGAALRLLPYLTLLGFGSAAALAAVAGLRRAALLPTDDRGGMRWIVAVFAVALALTFVPTMRDDGMRYYAYLRSLTIDGDLSFADEFAALDPHFDPAKLPPTATGMLPNNASVGPALAWAPLYGLAHLAALGSWRTDSPWPADGYSQPYIVLVCFGSALAGVLTLIGCYRIVRRWVGPGTATLTALALLFGSNLLYYTMRQGDFAHAISAASATLFVLAWLRLEERPSLGRWAALGAAAGGVAVTYWIGALTLVLPLGTFVHLLLRAGALPRGRGRAAGEVVAGGALAAGLALLVFAPQMLAWWAIYGSPLVIPHGGEYVRPRDPQLMSVLFSQLYGLLPWTPAFFAGLVGLPLLWRRSPQLAAALLISAGLYLWYNASLARWYAGGAFGLRRLTLLTPWFAIGLALLLDALRRVRRGLPAALAGVMAGWTTLLLVRYDLFLLPHVPEDIQDLPLAAFYLSRDALPFWGLPSWLTSGWFVQGWGGAAGGAALWHVAELTLLMAGVLCLAVWMGAAIERRATGRTR